MAGVALLLEQACKYVRVYLLFFFVFFLGGGRNSVLLNYLE